MSSFQRPWVFVLGSVLAVVGLGALLYWPGKKSQGQATLMVYCAAGIKVPLEKAAIEYEKEYGVKIEPVYGPSQTLLANLQASQGKGDLYLPADDSYIQMGREKGLLAEAIPLAHMVPVLAVAPGNPKNIRSLDDLLRQDVVLGLADPVAAIGKVTQEALQKAGRWDALAKRARVHKLTVNDIATALKVGSIDACFVWDVIARQYGLEAVPVPLFRGIKTTVTVSVTAGCQNPAAALRFARYLAAPEKGLPGFAQEGFETIEGDAWVETPELKLFSGAMLRPAIEQTIEEFKKREGVEVTVVYNGCGILVSQMKKSKRPDAYFSCDTSFMNQVNHFFLESTDVSGNSMVILVPKGNPKEIKELKDLGKPNLRVGLAHETNSALGALTKKLLEATHLYEQVRKNVTVDSATGDFLVNQIRAGSLDAVIVYITNAARSRDQLDVIPINVPSARAVQPFAVGRESRQKQLAQRFLEAVKSQESRQRFVNEGFEWKSKEKK